MSAAQNPTDNFSNRAYFNAVRIMRDTAKDEYDRLWWKIELETPCTLTSNALHKRVMRRLQKAK